MPRDIMPAADTSAKAPLLSSVQLKANEVLMHGAIAPISHAPNPAPIEVYEPSIAPTGNTGYDSGERGELSRLVHVVSFWVNILLFGSKLWVYIQSQSMVVLAALIDSTVDLLAQGILLLTNRLATLTRDPSEVVLYPAGRSRAEPIGVIACSLLMAMASAQVIRDSSLVLYDWWHAGKVKYIEIDALDEGLLAMTTFLKFVLYVWCQMMSKRTNNVTVEAVAQDHLNDVLSNSGALAAAAMTQLTPALWLADPVGAVVISIYIIYSWAMTGMEQLDLIIGRTAEPEFLDRVREMAETHDPSATLDKITAYHFGPRFLVEVEIVMMPDTALRESHDCGITLQHKIERLEQVERCFVHVDYQERMVDDHDPLTPLESVSSAVRSTLCGLLLFGSTATIVPTPALAASDGAAIGKCLLKKCQLPLARCVGDPTCAANLVCIQTCAANPATEGDCQIKCGDEFANDVTAAFTKCAVTDKSCVPQRGDDGSWPVPKTEALVPEFKPEEYVGKWYISAGLNKAFDTFDCQYHRFESPAENKIVGNLQWRIKDPIAGTNFVTRYAVQDFVQDPKVPGILYNGVAPYAPANDFLHYQDTWYVLAQQKDEYFLVYYRGTNDAWDGYGGAFIYSREPKLPKKYIPEIDAALQKIGRSFSEFTQTDNSCRAGESKLEEAKQDLVFVETRVAGGLAAQEKNFVNEIAKDFTLVEKEVVKDFVAVEKEVVKDITLVEKEIVKDVVGVEKEIEKDVKGIFGFK